MACSPNGWRRDYSPRAELARWRRDYTPREAVTRWRRDSTRLAEQEVESVMFRDLARFLIWHDF